MRIRLDLEDMGALSALSTLIERGEDLSPVMEAIAELGRAKTHESFQTQTSPSGEKWKPSWRAQHQGGKTLIDKGILKGSIGTTFDERSASWGFGMKYGIVHQLGATIKPKNGKSLAFTGADGHLRFAKQVKIPARPSLPDSIEQLDQHAINDILTAYLDIDN